MKDVSLDGSLRVSQSCLGTMNCGQPGQGRQDWTLDTDQARLTLKCAIDNACSASTVPTATVAALAKRW